MVQVVHAEEVECCDACTFPDGQIVHQQAVEHMGRLACLRERRQLVHHFV